jgi:hypothetical protein
MLAFCNSTNDEVWVAYMFYSPDTCGGEGGDWQTIGWYKYRKIKISCLA